MTKTNGKHIDYYAVAQWPDDVPLPTQTELAEAGKRMVTKSLKMYESGYTGDWGCDVHFTMATYAIGTWWDMFFPGDTRFENGLVEQIREIMNR